jgi:hypothetical protein
VVNPALQNDMIECQLEKILSSESFADSERVRRFHEIGIAAFDRPASFDPRSNTVVRMEARRLCAKLAEYYQCEGKNDSIHFELPKGAYVPVIHGQARP